MEEKKCILGYDRAVCMLTCTQRKLSENIQLKIVKIIKNAYLKSGSEGADEKAAELTELINRCKTEEEILKAIKQL